MKRLLRTGMLTVAIVAILLLLGNTVHADGEEVYDNPRELFSDWSMQDDYPECFTGAWVVEDMFYIGMTDDDAGHAEAEAVVALLRDKNSATIVYQKYTFRYLKTVMKELIGKMGPDGIMDIGIQQDKNYVKVGLSEYATKQERNELREELEKKYGDAVFVMSETAGFDTPTAKEMTNASYRTRNIALVAVLIIGIVALAIMTAVRIRVPAKGGVLSSNGDNAEAKSLEELIKGASVKTTKQFDACMLEEIESCFKG